MNIVKGLTKYQRQKKEYRLELERHENYKKQLRQLLNGNLKAQVPQSKMSRYTYLIKKIENTDSKRRYINTEKQIKLAKYQEEVNKQKEIKRQQELADKELDENRFEVLSDSDSD